jgi:hypothetical protein
MNSAQGPTGHLSRPLRCRFAPVDGEWWWQRREPNRFAGRVKTPPIKTWIVARDDPPGRAGGECLNSSPKRFLGLVS